MQLGWRWVGAGQDARCSKYTKRKKLYAAVANRA